MQSRAVRAPQAQRLLSDARFNAPVHAHQQTPRSYEEPHHGVALEFRNPQTMVQVWRLTSLGQIAFAVSRQSLSRQYFFSPSPGGEDLQKGRREAVDATGAFKFGHYAPEMGAAAGCTTITLQVAPAFLPARYP
jgi:hypothetical protein